MTKQYKNGDRLLYLGKEYLLLIGNYTKINIHGDHLLFPKALQFRIEKELTSWYIRNATNLMTDQVISYAKQMNTHFLELTFSDTKSQWGSCSHDNKLQFSWKLIKAPLLTMTYVIVHELAHTKEKNHSATFWSLVRRFNPSYRQQIKWLKECGSDLQK